MPFSRRIFIGLIAAACLLLALIVVVRFFEQLPIEGTSLALDWRGLHQAVDGGSVRYQNNLGFRIPPWSAVLIAPLGWLSFRASWGVLVLVTLAVLILSVPQHRLFLLSVLLVVVSFPSLRHIADGNFEALIIAGAVLTVIGYERQQPVVLALGLLLVISKPQESFMLVGVVGVYTLLTFPRKRLLQTAAAVLVIALPFLLWKGGEWITTMLAISQRGSIMDASLMAALNRTGLIPGWLIAVAWAGLALATLALMWRNRETFTREKAGALIAVSLLLAPYAAANSVLTVLAVGVIPLFQKRPWIGAVLIALINLPFVFPPDVQFNYSAWYTTALLLVIWGVLNWTTHPIAAERVTALAYGSRST